MRFSTFIENRLKKVGYSNIEWRCGNDGYFILVDMPYRNGRTCINVNKLVKDILFAELDSPGKVFESKKER